MTRRSTSRVWLWPLVIALFPLVMLFLVLWLVTALLALLAVWVSWCSTGRYALVIYSDSPIWRDYVESRILPDLRGRAVMLNWSERARWRTSLGTVLFTLFAGRRDFNPMAIVFK